MAADDRTPRPVDDTASAASATAQQPIVRTLQPRGQGAAQEQPVDIADLSKSP